MMWWESRNPFVRLAGYILVWLTPPCQHITRLISHDQEEALPWHRRRMLTLHYKVCIWCRRYEEQVRYVRKHAPGYDKHLVARPPSEKLSAEARERIRKAL
jgi:hypothetical protein